MYLNYANLSLDENGIPEVPTLMLKTLSNKAVGVIPGVFNLKMNIKFSEPSEISFDVPSTIDGNKNWIYDDLGGYKIIYTEHYGIYMTMNPTTDSDGMYEIKHIKGYSIEKLLDSKRFFLEEGTFKFYEVTNPHSPNTVFGRILESAIGWKPGYVSPTIAQKYRTFEQYDDFLLSFIYNTAPEKYRCVFVFDPYKKTINVYDADEEREKLPIYLDFDNLIESVGVEELSEELATAIRPYGADGLDIREVNPIGTGWIYDLSYFITNGDIPEELVERYREWQYLIQSNRSYFEGLSALRASITARLLSERVKLTELQGELDILISQQNVTIQALANETTISGKSNQQKELDRINGEIDSKKKVIDDQKAIIAESEKQLDGKEESSCVAKINAIVDMLGIKQFFTEEEYGILSNYFIEQDITEDTFVATDIDTSISGKSYVLDEQVVNISGSSITKLDLTSDFGKTMYSLVGGTFSFGGTLSVSGDIIRGTLEVNGDDFVLSIYAGDMSSENSTAPGGMITMDGVIQGLSSDISSRIENGITTQSGSSMGFNVLTGSMYLTANINDYKRYSVRMELYEYAIGVLTDLATPTYEFSVKSGNFLFAKEFAPFRNKLDLGRGIYVNIGGKQTITPYIIEFELDFEDKEKFSIVFSNRFKRHDAVNTLSDMIEKGYSSGRSFDASKYIYNKAANHATRVSDFMKSSLDAAVNTIVAASNQSVVINGSGIHVGGDSNYQIRIVDSMIAMTDDNWATAKLALGLFNTESSGSYFGVNAEVIGGKLIVGNSLIIENVNDDGVMQFMVDASGAWLNNATFVLQNQKGGNIIIDPKYGIAAGKSNLFTTDGTTVMASFIGEDGEITTDNDGMPTNSNFFLDIHDGNAYFRGKMMATSGKIGGFEIEDDYLYAGSGSNYVALNGSGKNDNSLYAMWAGSSSPESAPFYVKKDGTLYAKTGEFLECEIKDATFKHGEDNMMDKSNKFKADYLNLKGINVGDGNFVIDSDGKVTIKGNITMTGGSISWSQISGTESVTNSINTANNNASSALGLANTANTNASSALGVANAANGIAASANSQIYAWMYTGTTNIDGTKIQTGTVTASKLYGGEIGLLAQKLMIDPYGAQYKEDTVFGRIYLGASATGSGAVDFTSQGAMHIRTNGQNLFLGTSLYGSTPSEITLNYNGSIATKGVLFSSERKDLGYADFPWGNIYSLTGTIQQSDRNAKNSISYNFDSFEPFFDSLKPASFKMNDGTSGRTHVGFISQDVEESLRANGLDSLDFAGFIKSPVEDDDGNITSYNYALRYSEFIALCVHEIQRLKRRVKTLESQIE